jgi:hypothetical protein
MRTSASLAAAILFLSAGAALASDLDFTLVNKTGYDIKSIYVDPSNSNEWTDDILRGTLQDGQSVFIEFSGKTNICKWDLKVAWVEDYDSTFWKSINLCNVSEVTLRYNRNTDETTAFLK